MFINHPQRATANLKEYCEKKIVEVLAHYQVIGAYRMRFRQGDHSDWSDAEIQGAKFVM